MTRRLSERPEEDVLAGLSVEEIVGLRVVAWLGAQGACYRTAERIWRGITFRLPRAAQPHERVILVVPARDPDDSFLGWGRGDFTPQLALGEKYLALDLTSYRNAAEAALIADRRLASPSDFLVKR